MIIAAKERKERREEIFLRALRAFTTKPEIFDARKDRMKDIMELCDTVRQTSYDIHVYHGHGHLEKVYENALAHRLRKLGFAVKQQSALIVHDEDGTVIGEYLADLIIDDRLIIELKAAKAIADEHVAQLLGYLKSGRVEHGLIVNFGSYRFEIKKFAMSDKAQCSVANRLGSFLFSFFARTPKAMSASFASARTNAREDGLALTSASLASRDFMI